MSELVCRIALTKIKGVGSVIARRLVEACGSAEAVFDRHTDLRTKLPMISRRLIDTISDPQALRQAEVEAAWVEEHRIQALFLGTESYPRLLAECPDAPIVLYYKGEIDLLKRHHIVSVVGTRSITTYGRAAVGRILGDLGSLLPDLIIVSGLAYGVDVEAHKAALEVGLPTVGVLAHGLDRIYPSAHRSIAKEMCTHGGLITEYPSGTNPDRFNFVARNRIIAGLSPVTLVVESSEKGGSLITASLASTYDREILAIPGRITDKYSAGCNKLIAGCTAVAITSAQDLVDHMAWGKNESQGLPQTLKFAPDKEAPADEIQRRIWSIIIQAESIHIGDLSKDLGLSIPVLSAALFELEMDGYVLSLPGSLYAPT